MSAINQGVAYALSALHFARDALTKIAGFLPLDAELSVALLFLLVSLWAGHSIAKKFVTRPLSGSYFLWTLVISISIFLNLMYL
ncbi:MAG: hypothetical protein AABY22_32585 [Nanoarchaeota archaeon]